MTKAKKAEFRGKSPSLVSFELKVFEGYVVGRKEDEDNSC